VDRRAFLKSISRKMLAGAKSRRFHGGAQSPRVAASAASLKSGQGSGDATAYCRISMTRGLPLPQAPGSKAGRRCPIAAGPRARASCRAWLSGLRISVDSRTKAPSRPFAARTNGLLAIVPDYLCVIEDLCGKNMLLQVRLPQWRGEKNPRLALRAVQFRSDDVLSLGERLRFPKAGASAVRQKVPPAVASRSADTIGG